MRKPRRYAALPRASRHRCLPVGEGALRQHPADTPPTSAALQTLSPSLACGGPGRGPPPSARLSPMDNNHRNGRSVVPATWRGGQAAPPVRHEMPLRQLTRSQHLVINAIGTNSRPECTKRDTWYSSGTHPSPGGPIRRRGRAVVVLRRCAQAPSRRPMRHRRTSRPTPVLHACLGHRSLGPRAVRSPAPEPASPGARSLLSRECRRRHDGGGGRWRRYWEGQAGPAGGAE